MNKIIMLLATLFLMFSCAHNKKPVECKNYDPICLGGAICSYTRDGCKTCTCPSMKFTGPTRDSRIDRDAAEAHDRENYR